MANWTILGAGAIGCLWAGALMQQGQAVTLCLRQARQAQAYQPLQITLHDGSQTSYQPQWAFAPVTDTQVLLVTLKANQVIPALTPWQTQLSQHTPIILMHNGMGTAPAVRRLFPQNPLVLATTAQAALREAPFQVKHTGTGATWLGSLNAAMATEEKKWLTVMQDALPDVQWTDHIQEKRWLKLAINCAINPLTALHQCQNGELAKPIHRPLLTQLIEEVCAVAQAEGVDWSPTVLLEKVLEVTDLTADNFSSMNRDLHCQRPTEIDYITGHLLRCAQQHRIPAPINQALFDAIKEKEKQYG